MRLRSSSAAALAAALLTKDVLAAVHGRHYDYHRKRTPDLTVVDKVVTTVTDTIYVTVEWPGASTVAPVDKAAADDDLECDPTDHPAMPAAAATATVSNSNLTHVAPASSKTPAAAAAALPTTSLSIPFPVHPDLATATSSTTSSTTTTPPPMATSLLGEAPGGGVFVQVSTSAAPVMPDANVAPVAAPTTLAKVAKPNPTPAAAPPATGGGSSSKRGLAYNDASLTNGFTGANSQISWAYNWGPSSSGLTSGFEYVPMLWGNAPEKTGPWPQQASAAIAAGSKHLFSFNEPDIGSQSNIDYQTAARDHKTFMGPFAGKALIGAPAVTNGGGSMGLTYLSNFIGACTDCPIDFVNIHWYDSATNFGYFKQHVQAAYAAGGNRPVWITEFGASGTPDQQNAFLQVVIPWLDAQDYVQRYAYFMCSQGILVDGNSPNTLGNTFMSYTSSTISPLIAKSK